MDTLTQLLTTALELHKEGNLPAEEDLIKSLIGAIGEAQVMKLTEGTSVNGSYDVLGKIKYPGRIEVKTAFKSTQGLLGAWSLKSKKGKCDWVALVDASGILEGKTRVSIIPHDEAFAVIDNNPKGDEIRWSETYNETDKRQVENTDLFLRHEVIV